MEEQTKKMVPEIRVKGFSNEWDEKPIGEVLTEKKRSIELEDNELYELVTVRRRNGGVVSRGYLQGKDILVKNYSQLRTGDFIISKRQVVHGATGIVPQHLDKAIVSNEYMVAVGNENISSEFLTIISTLPDMYRKFFLSSYGVDIEKLFFDAADWKKRNVVLPKLPEQNEICSYFAAIDQMIGLHQRKHEKLVTLKKAMLKKMFPQNGASTPEVRFKGFAEQWKERNLLDSISKVIDFRGRTPKKLGLDWSKSGYLALSALNVKNGYIDFSIEAHYGNQELYDLWMKGNELHKNQVLFTTEAPMGNVAQILDDKKYILSQRTIAFVVDSEMISEDFLAVLLRSPLTFLKLSSFSSGGTAKGVSQKSISSLNVSVPASVPEQQKIGTYFRQLDELIAQHGIQVEKLKQIKTACLEKMFI